MLRFINAERNSIQICWNKSIETLLSPRFNSFFVWTSLSRYKKGCERPLIHSGSINQPIFFNLTKKYRDNWIPRKKWFFVYPQLFFFKTLGGSNFHEEIIKIILSYFFSFMGDFGTNEEIFVNLYFELNLNLSKSVSNPSTGFTLHSQRQWCWPSWPLILQARGDRQG